MSTLGLIVHAAVTGPLKHNALRSALSTFAIALGVALGIAVNVLNNSAIAEFTRAARVLAGGADIVVRGAAFDEKLYPALAMLPQVDVANPMIEIDVKVSGRRDLVKVLGIDPFQSTGVPAVLREARRERNLLEPDTVVVSSDAAERLDLEAGRSLTLQIGSQSIPFSVIAILPRESGARNVALMDIATAQWRLHMLGTINRIDLKLMAGVDAEIFRQGLRLPAGVHAVFPKDENEQASELSRAYRVNLNMLSLVALFTGSFLVFSTQALSVLRRRKQLALMRVLGLRRRSLTALVLCEAALIGTIGAALGVALGVLLAQAALRTFGPDLGAGYFRGITPPLEIEPFALIIFFVLGVAAALAGALGPAVKAAAAPPAKALKGGDSGQTGARSMTVAAVIALAAGVAASFAPGVAGLPLFGYAAIALILLGACLLTPALIKRALERLPEPRAVPARLALAHLRRSPGEAALSIVSILVAFSVMAAMAIMVASFRESLKIWLIKVLPADVYVRARGDAAFLNADEQRRLEGIPGVQKAALARYHDIQFRGSTLTLIARENPQSLPMVGEQMSARNLPPAWVSQVAADLHGFTSGSDIELPIAGKNVRFTVAGVWRDYSRQSGAIAIERALYVGLTGDTRVNDAALWLASGKDQDAVVERVRAVVGNEIDIAPASDLHSRSLAAFDRTFAVTYILEAVAVLVGLFGVSASFSAGVLDRRGEFGVLRHLGIRRRDIASLLAVEGGISSAAGTLFGLLLGTCLSVILIFVVNRQSFHWSMDMHVPWLALAAFSVLMIATATATAILSGRKAASDEMLRAVREDW